MDISSAQYCTADNCMVRITYGNGAVIQAPVSILNRYYAELQDWVSQGNEITEYQEPWQADIDAAKAWKKAAIQKERRKIDAAGVSISIGAQSVVFATDDRAILRYAIMHNKAKLDNTATWENWKANDDYVYVTLTADILADLDAAINLLWAATFAWQRRQNTMVDECETIDAVAGISSVYTGS